MRFCTKQIKSCKALSVFISFTLSITLTAILSFIAMPIAKEPFIMPPLPVWGSALFMGVAATAFALVAMNRVQQFMSSAQAILIYALEPVWAGVLGYLVGETFTFLIGIGCCCILMGMIIGDLHLSFILKNINMIRRNSGRK